MMGVMNVVMARSGSVTLVSIYKYPDRHTSGGKLDTLLQWAVHTTKVLHYLVILLSNSISLIV